MLTNIGIRYSFYDHLIVNIWVILNIFLRCEFWRKRKRGLFYLFISFRSTIILIFFYFITLSFSFFFKFALLADSWFILSLLVFLKSFGIIEINVIYLVTVLDIDFLWFFFFFIFSIFLWARVFTLMDFFFFLFWFTRLFSASKNSFFIILEDVWLLCWSSFCFTFFLFSLFFLSWKLWSLEPLSLFFLFYVFFLFLIFSSQGFWAF